VWQEVWVSETWRHEAQTYLANTLISSRRTSLKAKNRVTHCWPALQLSDESHYTWKYGITHIADYILYWLNATPPVCHLPDKQAYSHSIMPGLYYTTHSPSTALRFLTIPARMQRSERTVAVSTNVSEILSRPTLVTSHNCRQLYSSEQVRPFCSSMIDNLTVTVLTYILFLNFRPDKQQGLGPSGGAAPSPARGPSGPCRVLFDTV